MSRRITGLSVLLCEKGTELATNFLHESDKLVSSSLVLLAFSMVSLSSSVSCKYDGIVSPDCYWKMISVVSE